MTLLQNLKSHLAQKHIAWLIRRNTMVGPERIHGEGPAESPKAGFAMDTAPVQR